MKITQKIYEEIKNDIPKIEEAMKTKIGSQSLWKRFRSKYSVLIPGIENNVQVSGKMSFGDEFDYRSELEQLKEAILAHLIVNPIEEQSNEEVESEARHLLNVEIPSTIDNIIHKKIEESKIYIRSTSSNKKQIALEKIWDSFERLKTIYGEDKKASLKKLIDNISYDSEKIKERLNYEFYELTKIENSFQIRHFETGTEPNPSDSFREYLYFRILSLISYCINEVKR